MHHSVMVDLAWLKDHCRPVGFADMVNGIRKTLGFQTDTRVLLVDSPLLACQAAVEIVPRIDLHAWLIALDRERSTTGWIT